jgi:hypothetical protein
VRWFIQGLAPIRPQLGRIAFFGKWWAGTPLRGHKEHTYSDPSFLRRHGVEIQPSVRFGQVESAMSRARINPIFIRPLLRTFRLVTPRMFETFSGSTIPLLPPDFDYAEALYGKRAATLRMADDPAERIEYVLSHYQEVTSLVKDMEFELRRNHSYERRLSDLIGLFL